MNRIFMWKTIRKKFLKKSKTSAKKYHKTPIFGDKSSTVRINPYVLLNISQIPPYSFTEMPHRTKTLHAQTNDHKKKVIHGFHEKKVDFDG
jgi:hypothetical protein